MTVTDELAGAEVLGLAQPARSSAQRMAEIMVRVICIKRSFGISVGFAVMVSLPTEVSREGVFERIGHRGFGRGDVMFVAVSANELEELLELWHFDDAVPAEGVKFVLREAS